MLTMEKRQREIDLSYIRKEMDSYGQGSKMGYCAKGLELRQKALKNLAFFGKLYNADRLREMAQGHLIDSEEELKITNWAHAQLLGILPAIDSMPISVAPKEHRVQTSSGWISIS